MKLVRMLVVVAASALASACSTDPGEFSSALGDVVRAGNATEVDLAEVSPLQWDELHAFGPYSQRERNCEVLNLGWLACRTTFPRNIDEHEYFLVFRRGAEIVHAEHHWRRNGDFSAQTRMPRPILRSDARFQIKLASNRSTQRWYFLEHAGVSPP